MVSGYNPPGSSTWHREQRCSGVFFTAADSMDSSAAENRGLSPCGTCTDGEWPHEEEVEERDADEWFEELEEDGVALKMTSPSWKGPEYVGRRDDGYIMWPLGLDRNVGSTTEDSLRMDFEESTISIETVDFEDTPLAEDD